ncbi:hypothetical protein [Erysipelothrix anatis]|uniref:hypothetical protein n=1 Tax=Erysipelothrix anatis TaxID=2683713 RepID=UPI00135B1986|nr:hypothetical protein [Erysipelothrix anatis]
MQQIFVLQSKSGNQLTYNVTIENNGMNSRLHFSLIDGTYRAGTYSRNAGSYLSQPPGYFMDDLDDYSQ